MAMETDVDSRLVKQSLAGNMQAYGELVDRYRRRVYNLAYRMLGDPERAEDAAQEAFIRAYKGLRHYRPSGKFSSWLFATASNVCIDRLRKRPHASASIDDPNWRPVASDDTKSDPAEAADRSETQAAVHTALGRLPENQRLAITLVQIQGLSYEEASEVMQQPVGTVKSHAHRAKTTLKRFLIPYVQESAV